MNAVGVKDDAQLNRLLDDSAFVAQEKLDGMRAIVHVTKYGLRIFSRSAGVADPARPLEKTSALSHLAAIKMPGLNGSILDSEILLPGEDSATLSGTVHRKNGNGQNHPVKIFVFDILRYRCSDLMSKVYDDRLTILDEVKLQLSSPYISVLPVADTSKSKRALYNSVLKSGGEGILLKRLDAFYFPAARPSNNWYKAKRSSTFDCIVIGFTKGKGKYNTRIGAVRFGQYHNGKLVELGQASGMIDEIRDDMSANPSSWIGKVIAIKGMERLKSGAIRHPQYAGIRFDKKPEDCVWYQGEQ
jgi:ATP-dependent DNA ligase